MTEDSPDLRKEHIRQHAIALGFAAVSVTTSAPLACAPVLGRWLEQGRHGRMDYLARDVGRRVQPSAVMHDARSVIVTAFPYPPGPPYDPRWREKMIGRIAAYARGDDYHARVSERLEQLGEAIARSTGARFQVHVDAGPLVEKALAHRAGLGWYGHNTNVLTKRLGSYFVLGCLLTDLELAPDPPFAEDHCGDCRACLPACPTGALDVGPTIDARRCISYLTIEHRGPLPPSLRPLLGNWVFGCDDCQTVCPWNDGESQSDDADVLTPSLSCLLALTEDEFASTYARTAVARVRRRGLARNAALALGNSGNPNALEPLTQALRDDPEPIVRGAAAWAIGSLGTAGARRALEAVHCASEVAPVAAEVHAALSRLSKATAVVSPRAAVEVV